MWTKEGQMKLKRNHEKLSAKLTTTTKQLFRSRHPYGMELSSFIPDALIEICLDYADMQFCETCKICFPSNLPQCLGCLPIQELRSMEQWTWVVLKNAPIYKNLKHILCFSEADWDVENHLRQANFAFPIRVNCRQANCCFLAIARNEEDTTNFLNMEKDKEIAMDLFNGFGEGPFELIL